MELWGACGLCVDPGFPFTEDIFAVALLRRDVDKPVAKRGGYSQGAPIPDPLTSAAISRSRAKHFGLDPGRLRP